MTAIRRSQTRRRMARLAGAHDPALFEVLDAVITDPDREPASVTTVAERLGVDQPRASRPVSRAVELGLVRRTPDQVEARRVLLLPTARGELHLEAARATRQEIFDRAMEGWTETDRDAFASLLTRFVAGFDQVTRNTRP